MISGGRKGAALLLLKRMYFWELKCTIFSPLSVKVYTYIRFWGLQGGSVPLPIGKLVFPSYLRIISGPFWSNFSDGYKGAALLVIKECVFGGTKSAQFQSLSCQIYTLRGGSPSFHKRMCISGEP